LSLTVEVHATAVNLDRGRLTVALCIVLYNRVLSFETNTISETRMSYLQSDPRSALAASAKNSAPAATEFAAVEFGLFYEREHQETDPNGPTWYTRGQNFLVAYSKAEAGAVFGRKGQPDEYVLLIPSHGTPIEITAAQESKTVDGFSLIIMPPGDSTITMPRGGEIVRLFTTRSKDLAAKSSNAESYEKAHPNIPPFEPWPRPPGGYRIRAYNLDVPKKDGRFGRIWRCTTFMVNYLDPQHGPRDVTKLSPHFHDDFEQCSLAVQGTFMHHLRWPWTANMNTWRKDEHVFCASPSVCVIPPSVIHTTRAMDAGMNQLVDIFSPPRVDFSQQSGWVLNADEYPAPA
jgi:hypothetical protein